MKSSNKESKFNKNNIVTTIGRDRYIIIDVIYDEYFEENSYICKKIDDHKKGKICIKTKEELELVSKDKEVNDV